MNDTPPQESVRRFGKNYVKIMLELLALFQIKARKAGFLIVQNFLPISVAHFLALLSNKKSECTPIRGIKFTSNKPHGFEPVNQLNNNVLLSQINSASSF